MSFSFLAEAEADPLDASCAKPMLLRRRRDRGFSGSPWERIGSVKTSVARSLPLISRASKFPRFFAWPSNEVRPQLMINPQ